MQKAIIIGASSGIGWELAKVIPKNGYSLGLVVIVRDLRSFFATGKSL